MRRLLAVVPTVALAFAACSEPGQEPLGPFGDGGGSSPTVTYTGQGFTVDESATANVNDERCGADGQGTANDGSTGQFANWNGSGQPYEIGQPYLVWVLSLNTGKNTVSVTLHLPDGEVQMIKVGGTYKYASKYYAYEDLLTGVGGGPVHATFSGSAKNVQLVVSHGCQPFEEEGAWCSPGYWRNASDGAWQLIGYANKTTGFADLFNNTVVPDFYSQASAAAPTLGTVLTTSGANTFGHGDNNTAYPGLNAFNATGAYLTEQIPGFTFDPNRIGDEDACPIDNHGNFKS
jgi:hypothetical protein